VRPLKLWLSHGVGRSVSSSDNLFCKSIIWIHYSTSYATNCRKKITYNCQSGCTSYTCLIYIVRATENKNIEVNVRLPSFRVSWTAPCTERWKRLLVVCCMSHWASWTWLGNWSNPCLDLCWSLRVSLLTGGK